MVSVLGVSKIHVRGADTHNRRALIERRPLIKEGMIAELRERGVSADYHLRLSDGRAGIFRGRVADLPPQILAHTLNPGDTTQTYATPNACDYARFRLNRVLAEHPDLFDKDPARFQPLGRKSIDWANVPFGINPGDSIFYATIPKGGDWKESAPNVGEALYTYGDLVVSPAAPAMHYGQAGWEGMSARRGPQGRIIGFRWMDNALRFQSTSIRAGSTPVPTDLFLDAVAATVMANQDSVPPFGSEAISYIRPWTGGIGKFQDRTAAGLGVTISPVEAFFIYTSLVGLYHKNPLRLLIPNNVHRSGPGGTGSNKLAGNYIVGMKAQLEAKAAGFDELLHTDALTESLVEESGSANFFCVKDRVIYTPSLRHGTILPGITRESIISIALLLGYRVEELDLPVDQMLKADEAFETGNAVGCCAVGSVTDRDGVEHVFGDGQEGPITKKLSAALRAFRLGIVDDPSIQKIDREIRRRLMSEWVIDVEEYANRRGLI